METFWLVWGFAALVALVIYLLRRAQRDPLLQRDKWKPPAIGSRWEHCGRLLTVVDDGWVDEEWNWREGVACDYVNEDGHLERVHFTPAQWDAVLANNSGNVSGVYARVPHDCDGYGRDE